MLGSNKGTLAVVVLMKIFIYGGTHLLAEANGKKIADIYWNTSNPIFFFDNNHHIFVVRILDSIDIICPKYRNGFPEHRMEYSLIYLVDARSYETCSIDNRNAHVVGICSRPYDHQVITIVFREFTPSPGGLEFRANKTYYVISTSDGSKSGLKNEHGGLCSKYNMRLKFLVKSRCRTNSAATAGDSRQEDEDCPESERNRAPPLAPPLWEVAVRPPQFPREPFAWPNSVKPALPPKDSRRLPSTSRSCSTSTYSTSKAIWLLQWMIVLVWRTVR